MCIKSDFIDICLKLATNGQKEKDQNVDPNALSAPTPGLYTRENKKH